MAGTTRPCALLLVCASAAVASAACATKDDGPIASAEPARSSIAPPPPTAGPAPAPSGSAGAAVNENDPAHHAALLAIAERYGSFSRVDGTWWSHLDCSAPPAEPSHMSNAAAGSAHGRKVFTLQIYDFETYARETGGRPEPPRSARAGKGPPVAGVEQALVKVSYEPTEEPGNPRMMFPPAPATFQGKKYYPGEQKDLFIMYRPSDKSVATDAGWLYGTVSPDGKTVTSAGFVKNCMDCHEDAPHGRQFGVR